MELMTWVSVFFLSSISMAHSYEQQGIIIEDAWVRNISLGEETDTEAYLTITNNTDKAVVLNKLTTQVAKTVDMYHIERINGVKITSKVESMEFAPQGQAVFSPSSYFLKLRHVKNPMKEDELLEVLLHFQDGQTVPAKLKVRTHRRIYKS